MPSRVTTATAGHSSRSFRLPRRISRCRRRLAASLAGAGQQHVCHVGAGDKQDQESRSLQDQQRHLDITDQVLVERSDGHSPARIPLRVLLLQPGSNQVHLGLGLLERTTRIEARDHLQVMGAPALGDVEVEGQGCPKV